ncbi:hypothetical protein MKX01_010281 [Papaver californicum]|nr:hypothetical protein MKX01_010281 [Papaver californicum]
MGGFHILVTNLGGFFSIVYILCHTIFLIKTLQTYACNGAKAIHLNSWPSKFSKDGTDPLCEVCKRVLIPKSNGTYCPLHVRYQRILMKEASLNFHFEHQSRIKMSMWQ